VSSVNNNNTNNRSLISAFNYAPGSPVVKGATIVNTPSGAPTVKGATIVNPTPSTGSSGVSSYKNSGTAPVALSAPAPTGTHYSQAVTSTGQSRPMHHSSPAAAALPPVVPALHPKPLIVPPTVEGTATTDATPAPRHHHKHKHHQHHHAGHHHAKVHGAASATPKIGSDK
jgi:hypothetical protein